MKKEEIYVNLKGKTKEELTDLWEFLNDAGESNYSMLDEFISNTYWGYLALDTGDWALCKKSYTINKHEVTIEQLKQIIKPMKTKFTPIAMKCTQEQFEAIKPKLKNCEIELISDFTLYKYLTNNYNNLEKRVSNVTVARKNFNKRTVYEEWNEEIFLQACGIEVETMENTEEQLRKEAIERGFVNGAEFYGSKGNQKDVPMLISDNIKYYEPRDSRGNWGLYVNNSWLCYKGAWGSLVKDTLQQQLEKAKAEVKRLEEEIENNKPKDGDWVVRRKDNCIWKISDYIHSHPIMLKDCDKITNPELIKLLEHECSTKN